MTLKNVKSISISITDRNQVMKEVMESSMQRKPFSGHTSTFVLALKKPRVCCIFFSTLYWYSIITCGFLINISVKKANGILILCFNRLFMNNLGKNISLKHAEGVLMYKTVSS